MGASPLVFLSFEDGQPYFPQCADQQAGKRVTVVCGAPMFQACGFRFAKTRSNKSRGIIPSCGSGYGYGVFIGFAVVSAVSLALAGRNYFLPPCLVRTTAGRFRPNGLFRHRQSSLESLAWLRVQVAAGARVALGLQLSG